MRQANRRKLQFKDASSVGVKKKKKAKRNLNFTDDAIKQDEKSTLVKNQPSISTLKPEATDIKSVRDLFFYDDVKADIQALDEAILNQVETDNAQLLDEIEQSESAFHDIYQPNDLPRPLEAISPKANQIVKQESKAKKQRQRLGIEKTNRANRFKQPEPPTNSKVNDEIVDAEKNEDTKQASTTDAPLPKKSSSKLKFEEKQIERLEQKAKDHAKKLEQAHQKLPTKKVKKKVRVYDETKKKAVKSKLTFEEAVPIHQAKWNQPKKQGIAKKGIGGVSSQLHSKVHQKVSEVEHENVGVKTAHEIERYGEKGARTMTRGAKSAYQFYKNRPYRKVEKLEIQTRQTDAKLQFKKAVQNQKPQTKSNPISKVFQRRKIKQQYVKQIRATKLKPNLLTKAGKSVILRFKRKISRAIFWFKLGGFGAIVLLMMSMLTMCVSMFSGIGGAITGMSYLADYSDINDASILYTELETDLNIFLIELEANYPDWDEYRFSLDAIGHDPHQLMAFLTAKFHEFTFSEVEPFIHYIFSLHYDLSFEPVTETRQRWELTEDGYELITYDWHILYVRLVARPFHEVLMSLLDDNQIEHFDILMETLGLRQFVGSPFDFYWLPYVTSHFGYRVHPISGGRQFHNGIDIGLPEGTPILSGFDGVVVTVGYDAGGYGNFVIIDDGAGLRLLYAHAHTVLVVTGQPVTQGQPIATVGTTGGSTGDHLHMEVIRNGVFYNPAFFVDTGRE